MQNRIPDSEFQLRIKNIQEELNRRDLDALIVHSNEAEFANVRYLSDYWPVFESAGVVVPREGEAILLIGPESETFAHDRSRIKRITKVLQYRESAQPEYPGVQMSTFKEVFSEASQGKGIKRLGISGYPIMPISVYDAIRNALQDSEIIWVDDLPSKMRMIKSPNEISMLREAYRISAKAIDAAFDALRPGMTELQAVGIAEKVMYENGAEYEGHPQYVLSGRSSAHAISRPSHKKLKKGELVQLNIGARVAGYSSSIGRPVCLGGVSTKMRKLVKFGLEAHRVTGSFMKEGVQAKEVAKKFYEFAKNAGYGNYLLYGPCHGIGLIEVEPPWVELTSEYALSENMTFQIDTFLAGAGFGLRWEDGARVTKKGIEEFSAAERILEKN